jgi:hypothetical protein
LCRHFQRDSALTEEIIWNAVAEEFPTYVCQWKSQMYSDQSQQFINEKCLHQDIRIRFLFNILRCFRYFNDHPR